jgi:hypothetical protein
MTNATASDDSMPWFLKAAIAAAVLVVLFVVVVDLLAFASAL